jgi:hypothetical protein
MNDVYPIILRLVDYRVVRRSLLVSKSHNQLVQRSATCFFNPCGIKTLSILNLVQFRNLCQIDGFVIKLTNACNMFIPPKLRKAAFHVDSHQLFASLLSVLDLTAKRDNQSFQISLGGRWSFIRDDHCYLTYDVTELVLNSYGLNRHGVTELYIKELRDFVLLGDFGNEYPYDEEGPNNPSVVSIVKNMAEHGDIFDVYDQLLEIYITRNRLIYADRHMRKYLCCIVDEHNDVLKMEFQCRIDYSVFDDIVELDFLSDEVMQVVRNPQMDLRLRDAPGKFVPKETQKAIAKRVRAIRSRYLE